MEVDVSRLVGGNEENPVYQQLEADNGYRHYGFMQSIIRAANDLGTPLLSHSIIKALNSHAIAGLHAEAGQYRSTEVTVGNHTPPLHDQVPGLMQEFVDTVHRDWEPSPPTQLAAYALWRINYIHPFINGNGRTARAVCYFVRCVKAGLLLPGKTIVPELLRSAERDRYVAALQLADQTNGHNLTQVTDLLSDLLTRQLAS